MSISIIIPSYNSGSTIGKCLEGVRRQTADIHEVIIVDSSDEDQSEVLKKRVGRSENVRLVSLENKTIPAIARNLGANESKSDLLVFLDSDAYPDDRWLSEISKAYKAGVLVGGGSIDIPDFQKKNRIATAQYFLQFNEFTPNYPEGKRSFVPSCNIFCDRTLFNDIGGFPEIRASEDVLFGLAASSSQDVFFLPKSTVFHIFGESLIRLKNNQKLLGTYVALYRRKNGNRFFYRRITQSFLFPAIPLIKYFMLTGRVIRFEKSRIVGFLGCTYYIFIGLIYWSIGYISGIFESQEA